MRARRLSARARRLSARAGSAGSVARAVSVTLLALAVFAVFAGCGGRMPRAQEQDLGLLDHAVLDQAPPRPDGGPADLPSDWRTPADLGDLGVDAPIGPPPDHGPPPAPRPGCTAQRTSNAVLQQLSLGSFLRGVHVTKSGGTIAVYAKELVLYDGGTVVRVPSANDGLRSTFFQDRLVLQGSPMRIYDDRLLLQRTIPEANCDAMVFLDAKRLVCGRGKRWRIYDISTGVLLKESQISCDLGTWEMRRLGPSHLVLAKRATHESLAVLEVKADNSVQCLCTGPQTGAWVTRHFVADQGAKQVILPEGDLLKVFGSTCTATSADYFSYLGQASHGKLPLLKRTDPLNKEFFAVLADDGQTLVGVVDTGSVPFTPDCLTRTCQLVSADIATRARLHTLSLPPIPIVNTPASHPPIYTAYSTTCRYLAVLSQDNYHSTLMRLWLP